MKSARSPVKKPERLALAPIMKLEDTIPPQATLDWLTLCNTPFTNIDNEDPDAINTTCVHTL